MLSVVSAKRTQEMGLAPTPCGLGVYISGLTTPARGLSPLPILPPHLPRPQEGCVSSPEGKHGPMMWARGAPFPPPPPLSLLDVFPQVNFNQLSTVACNPLLVQHSYCHSHDHHMREGVTQQTQA